MSKKMVMGIMRDLEAEEKEYRAWQKEIGKAASSLRRNELLRVMAQHELESDEFLTAEEKAKILLGRKIRKRM